MKHEDQINQQTEEEVSNLDTESDDSVEFEAENSGFEPEVTAEEARIAELEKQLEESSQRLLRVQADYDNFRRRTREEQAASLKYKSMSLIEQLLPALDNFERALQFESDNEQTANLLSGMSMVYRQIQEACKNEGLEQIDTIGQTFDPNLHQAVMQVEDESFEKNTVVEELQKGYRLKDRVVRPAMVKVNA
ncbi:nucleotide exchange factor GrpE [Fictibacillus aquaticus]|uniref:Protein GrpE n=1 Tax=Fictibacillus aquaticus TaxID=2021314 RepID=A0A235FA83_9BACL|nr:nucleotide exchange factor GrpE [Fictibacillus aquaticus]OYD57964.1 nucleotide exchange factor GrpE [Fictibacillus aquaticus]